MGQYLFSVSDADVMLQLSEGPGGVLGTGKGHTRERHVAITNAGMMQRLYSDGGTVDGIAVYTAFLTYDDCKAAISDGLSAESSYAEMTKFYKNCPIGKFWTIRAELPRYLQIRVAFADGVKSRYDRFIKLRLMKDPTRLRDIHLVTAHPVFAAGTVGLQAPPGDRYRAHGRA